MVKVIHKVSGKSCEAAMYQKRDGLNNVGFFLLMSTLQGYSYRYTEGESVFFQHSEHGNTTVVEVRPWDWVVIARNGEGFTLVSVYSDDNFNRYFRGVNE